MFQSLLLQATEEIQRLRRQLSRAKTPSPSKKVSSILERVEKERDDAYDELRRLKGEMQSLENQLDVSGCFHSVKFDFQSKNGPTVFLI